MSDRAPIFRLDRVLRHREEQERQHERALALALADLQAQEQVLASAFQRHESALDRMRDALADGRIAASSLLVIQSAHEHAAVDVHRAREARDHRDQGAAQARDALVAARQGREVIGRLRERYLARAHAAQLRREQAELDDMAQATHSRAKSSATPPRPAYTPSTQTSEDVLMQ